MGTSNNYFMKRTFISGETKRVADFLSRLLRRCDPGHTELIGELKSIASGRSRKLSVFDKWIDRPHDLAYYCAMAMRDANGTKSYLMQACNYCSGRKNGKGIGHGEMLRQRYDLINTLVW